MSLRYSADFGRSRLVEIFYQPTEEMAADIFTKALGKLKHEKHRNYLLGEHLLKDADLSYSGKIPGKV